MHPNYPTGACLAIVGVLAAAPAAASQDIPVRDVASGHASLATSIPNNPLFAGSVANLQILWAWSPPCVPSPLGLSSSSAVAVTIQP